MKLNYDINWTVIRIPILPWLKITKIEPEIQIREVRVEVPSPQPVERTPEPVQDKLPKPHGNTGRKGRQDMEGVSQGPKVQDPSIPHFRRTGAMAGTERYRSDHARQDLIRLFIDRNNNPLSMYQLKRLENSPFKHNYVKCEEECTHRIISRGTLHAVLRNDTNKYDSLLERYKTNTIFIRVKANDDKGKFSSKYDSTKAAYQLAEDVYFRELNRLRMPEYINIESEELPRTLEEKINIPKKKYGYQAEAIDRMT